MMKPNKKRQLLEAILFSAPSFVSIEHLNQFFQEDIRPTLEEIKNNLNDSGYTLLERDYKVALVTKKDFAKDLQNFWGIEDKEFSKASLEVLAVIAYAGPVSKSEINKIRGLNSTYILNRLILRGLVSIQKIDKKKYYRLSPEFLNFLGIEKESDLPEYKEIREELTQI